MSPAVHGPLFYRWLLRLYPAAFRIRFAEEMTALVVDRRARVHGRTAAVSFWLRTALDTCAGAWRARRALHAGSQVRRTLRPAVDAVAALRSMARAPQTPLTLAALTALMTTSSVAVFAVVHAILLSPLPYPEPDRVVMLWEQRAPSTGRNVVGAHEFPEWRARARTFDELAAFVFGGSGASLTGAGEPLALVSVRVTARFFDVFGVEPALGRTFHPEEDRPGAAPVAVIAHHLWRDRFAGATDVIGREILVNDVPTTVVGVAADGFDFPAGPAGRAPDIWMPIAEPIQLYRGRHYLFAIGRIAGGRTIDDARADLASIAGELAEEWPDGNRGHGVLVNRLADELTRDVRPSLLALAAAVSLLALVGCVNLAGLATARTHAMGPMLRLKLALGAGAGRLAWQAAVDAVVPALAGGLAGIAGASALLGVLPSIVPPDVLPLRTLPLDRAAIGVAVALTALAALATFVATWLQMPRDVLPTRRDHDLRRPVVRGVRPMLVVTQIAIAFALLVTSATLAERWRALDRVDPGFTTTGILTLDLALPDARFADAVRQRLFYDRLDEALRQTPGVMRVATASLLPLGGGRSTVALAIEGRPAPARGQEPSVSYRVVGADYFDMLGIRVTAGRGFSASDRRLAVPLIRWYPQQPAPPLADRPQPEPVAVISRLMAETHWPNEDAIGRRFRIIASPWVTVIGVVDDTRNWSLDRTPTAELYLFDGQEPQSRQNVLIQTDAASPMTLAPAVCDVVRRLDAALPVIALGTLEDVVFAEIRRPRLTSLVAGAFASLSVLLMASGLYALMTFATGQRTREIGIRMALGARPASIRGLVLAQSASLIAAGLTVGLLLSAPLLTMLGRLSEMFGDASRPTPAMAVAALTIATIALAASWPALRRATRIDPAITLRT